MHARHYSKFQHTAARRRLHGLLSLIRPSCRFNTQPLEGGCLWTYASCQSAIPFQHTAARRRLPFGKGWVNRMAGFQHTAARRRLRQHQDVLDLRAKFQHTAARRRLQDYHASQTSVQAFQHTAARRRLRIQIDGATDVVLFQHTAARRRLHLSLFTAHLSSWVSTHSRPKTAAGGYGNKEQNYFVSTHSRPKTAAGALYFLQLNKVSFNTQPPEDGCA